MIYIRECIEEHSYGEDKLSKRGIVVKGKINFTLITFMVRSRFPLVHPYDPAIWNRGLIGDNGTVFLRQIPAIWLEFHGI